MVLGFGDSTTTKQKPFVRLDVPHDLPPITAACSCPSHGCPWLIPLYPCTGDLSGDMVHPKSSACHRAT